MQGICSRVQKNTVFSWFCEEGKFLIGPKILPKMRDCIYSELIIGQDYEFCYDCSSGRNTWAMQFQLHCCMALDFYLFESTVMFYLFRNIEISHFVWMSGLCVRFTSIDCIVYTPYNWKSWGQQEIEVSCTRQHNNWLQLPADFSIADYNRGVSYKLKSAARQLTYMWVFNWPLTVLPVIWCIVILHRLR